MNRSRNWLGCLLLVLACHAVSAQQATVFIGKQEWMARNLDVDRYSDGGPIPEAKTIAEWISYNERRIGCYCKYDNEVAYGTMYGKLYNWYAVKRGIAPHCWRLPNKGDYDRLIAFLGGEAAAKKLKATHSWSNDWNGTNASGFGGFAGGCRNDKGTFSYVGRKGFWWTNEARKPNNSKETGLVFSIDYEDKCNYDITENFGFAVRCVRDAHAAPPEPCP